MERLISEMTYPTAALLGAGACERLGACCELLGMHKPLLLTDQATLLAGLVDRVIGELKREGKSFGLFSGVVARSGEREIEDGVEAFLSQGADGIIALGGQWPLEVGKLVRLMTTHERPISRYDAANGGERFVTRRLPPLVSVPTVPGSGTEATAATAVRVGEPPRKLRIEAPALMPDIAVCDPELTMELAPEPTGWAGMLALSHGVEAFCAAGFHPLADALAIDGIARVARGLPRVMAEPRGVDARTELMIGSLAGAAALQKGLGACEALAQAAAEVAGVDVGQAAAVLLPAVMEFNRPVIGSRLAKVAVALGEDRAASTAELGLAAIGRVKKLAREARVPATLREIRVREELLPAIVERAFEDPARLANPRELSRDELDAIVHSVM